MEKVQKLKEAECICYYLAYLSRCYKKSKNSEYIGQSSGMNRRE